MGGGREGGSEYEVSISLTQIQSELQAGLPKY